MNELRNRGVEDVLLAVVDRLKDFPEAILAVFPEATIQPAFAIGLERMATNGSLHLLRHSLDFVSYKDRRTVAAALKDIYRAVDAAAAEAALTAFEQGAWPALPSHRPELAAGLGRGRPVLCIPRRCPPHSLHHACHRGAELETAPGGAGQGPFSD